MVTLVTYADSNYAERQERLCKENYGVFDKIYAYREWDIEYSYFKENEHILTQKRGAGCWLWKSYLLYKTLYLLRDGDIILYMDCGDVIVDKGVREFIEGLMKDKNIVLTKGAYKNSDWTKRDCFVYMNCDEPEYHNAIQIEAGVMILKKSVATWGLLYEWMTYCQNEDILTDKENTCGLPNLEGFKEHRHDQAILSLMCYKYNLYQSNEIRKYVHCNKR